MGLKISASRFEGPVYAAFRFVSGAMFMFHGVQKILGVLSQNARPSFGTQGWFGGMIELVCGALIAAGLFTRAAAFLASGTMAVAYFQFHWKLQLGAGKWLPNVNKGELAALYCFVFLFIATRGGGPASLDRRFGRG
jgi:putative oxidoreductase